MPKDTPINKKTTSIKNIRMLSPCRNTTEATTIEELTLEQLLHFGIEPESEFGVILTKIIFRIYECQDDIHQMWKITQESIFKLSHSDKIALFNAKKFLSFQLAKILDTVQNPLRQTYQNLEYSETTRSAKGSYPLFDNVTALFSATPVIARTATYIYACTEWIEDAFKGKELLLEIYSRLLNPTSLSLANHIVDLEAGPYSGEYFAWNYNSGMAAIDGVLSHVLGHQDVLITSLNIYGGAYQLINDWYKKPSNLDIAVEQFSGESVEHFLACWHRVKKKYAARLEKHAEQKRHVYLYLESPSNPHGYILDVPQICIAAHRLGLRVILDSTIATPFLCKPLLRENKMGRPDFLIHSYTKDLSGTGSVIAGVVVARNEDMFAPKGSKNWEKTMFWNVYYVKGAFLNADSAYEVLQGMRTLDVRMLNKCINTLILAHFLNSHPQIQVHANCLPENHNFPLMEKLSYLGLPAPLFTIDINGVSKKTFKRFFDCLSPTFGHMVSLGQTNSIISCPGLTTHSELNNKELSKAGIHPTTIRFAMGNEDPKDLIHHIVSTAKLIFNKEVSGFSDMFMSPAKSLDLIKNMYLLAHRKYIEDKIKNDPHFK